MEKDMELNLSDLGAVAGGADSTGCETMPGTIVNTFKDPRPKARVNLDSGERLTCLIDLKLWNQSGPEALAPGVRVQVYKSPSMYVVMSIME